MLLLYMGLVCADGYYPPHAEWLGGREAPDSGGKYYFPYPELVMMMYLKISISDFLTLFSARCKEPFWSRPPSVPLFVAFLVATLSATLIATMGRIHDDYFPMQPISGKCCAAVWLWKTVGGRGCESEGGEAAGMEGMWGVKNVALLAGVAVSGGSWCRTR